MKGTTKPLMANLDITRSEGGENGRGAQRERGGGGRRRTGGVRRGESNRDRDE